MTGARFETLMLAALAANLAGEPVRLPAGGELPWLWFSEISAGRTWHNAGPNPIGWGDIAAYRALSGWPLRGEDIRLVMAMDRTFVSAMVIRSDEGAPAPAARPAPKAGLNAMVFDAMFGETT